MKYQQFIVCLITSTIGRHDCSYRTSEALSTVLSIPMSGSIPDSASYSQANYQSDHESDSESDHDSNHEPNHESDHESNHELDLSLNSSTTECTSTNAPPGTRTIVRFAVAGLIGNAIFFGLDRALLPKVIHFASICNYHKDLSFSSSSSSSSSLLSLLPSFIVSKQIIAQWTFQNAATISFFLAYLLDIFFQHLLNALLVFGFESIQTKKLYISSLMTAYTTYFGTLCLSTVLRAWLLRRGFSKSISFWGTLGIGSVINYVLLNSTSRQSRQEINEKSEEI